MRRPLLLTLLAAFALGSCGKSQPPTSPFEVLARSAPSLPASPSDPAWDDAPEHVARLILQDLVEPRLLEASTSEIRVRAIASDGRVAFRLEWIDSTRNDLSKSGQFVDACALQVPALATTAVPDPQMGGAGARVEISYWNAEWQAQAEGRGDRIQDVYPNASVDHYPFESAALAQGSPEQKGMASRYSPARALGNPVSGPHATPVQDLIAEGPGTITPAERSQSAGRGERVEHGWSVVITRDSPAGFGAGTRGQIAFAVWEGSHQEVGPRKMRTGWIPLGLQEAS